ncbi:MAG: dihydroorotase, partial [Ignisphaera sp.]|nr:dihydroorotase [Ignisphaera sp.]
MILIVKAFVDGRTTELTLVIEDGFVIRRIIGENRDMCREGKCIDLRHHGVTVPGFIDIHTHLRGLELEYKEDEESGTRAAARGGFTAVVDMPNTVPKINNINALKAKLNRLNLNSYVYYGIYISPLTDTDELNAMLSREGVIGIKIFPEDLKYLQIALNTLRRRGFDKIVVIHAEHPSGIDECSAGDRWRCRPIELELMCLNYLKRYLMKGDRVHITHITNPFTLFYSKKLSLTTDTCPHYLYLSAISERRYGCLAKVNPPLRAESTRRVLINLIRHFDAIATDHAPHSIHEKSDLFEKCPSGIASIDIVPSLVMNLIHRDVLSMSDVVRLLSLGPAGIIGLHGRWGCFEEGCIASYTVVDPYREFKVESSQSFSKAKYSPFEGMVLRGSVTATVVEG